ncbi:MAG TPA: DMT family transporter [Micropepsaceae bacterium]|nr:DMT family transporter [Micropepsaceae bacterium]
MAVESTDVSATSRDRPLLGIASKVLATLLFAFMFASIRWLGTYLPVGEIVFFRGLLGMIVIVIVALAAGGPQLLLTRHIGSHAVRSIAGTISMFCYFSAYIFLPLADATAITFASPLFVVILAAMMLDEKVHAYRWSAVVIGFLGVLVIVGPEANLARGAALGASLALMGAALAALAMIYIRRMSAHEHSVTIAFYFMVTSCTLSLLTLPFGWTVPGREQALVLLITGCSGGIGQVFLSLSYRYSEASVLAPFDYVAMIWAVVLGYFVFDELPTVGVWIGAAIVIAAGLMILWRERKLHLERGTPL